MRLPLPTIALAVLNGAALIALVTLALQGTQRDELLQAQSLQSTKAPASLEVPPASVQFESIRDAAIFHQARSFYVAPAAATFEQPPPDYRLTGSMSVPSRPLTALLLHNQSKERVKVIAGDQLEGWTVIAVEARQVTIQLGERREQIGSAAAPSNGVTIVAQDRPKAFLPASGVVRVPAGTAASANESVAEPPAAASISDKPRLYRPPDRLPGS